MAGILTFESFGSFGSFESFTRSRIDDDAGGFELGHAKQRLGILGPEDLQYPYEVTAYGRHLIFDNQSVKISPDNRWLAYEANDSGQFDIYVRPYPDANSGHWQVSTGGGTRPLWSRSGEELFFVRPDGAIMKVDVGRGASWSATEPVMIVKPGYATQIPGFVGRTYDISPDGRRFLMIKEGNPEQAAAPSSIVVVQHFDEELKRLVPVK